MKIVNYSAPSERKKATKMMTYSNSPRVYLILRATTLASRDQGCEEKKTFQEGRRQLSIVCSERTNSKAMASSRDYCSFYFIFPFLTTRFFLGILWFGEAYLSWPLTPRCRIQRARQGTGQANTNVLSEYMSSGVGSSG